MTAREIRVPVPGGDIAVRDHGGHGRDVLLFHSIGYNQSVWDKFAADLAADAHVVSFDLRGHGQSSADVEDPLQVIDDVGIVVEALELHCPVLVGHQFGGTVAAMAAARFPQLAEALCLIDSPVLESGRAYAELLAIMSSDSTIAMLTQRFGLGLAGADAASLSRFVDEYAEIVAADWLGTRPSPQRAVDGLRQGVLVAPDGSWLRRPTPETIYKLTTLPAEFPVLPGRELLARTEAAVWVIQPRDGDYGRGVDRIVAMAVDRPGWGVRMVEGDSHIVHKQPEVFRSVFQEFLDELAERRRRESVLVPEDGAPGFRSCNAVGLTGSP